MITFSISSIAQPPDVDQEAPLAADFLEFLADFSDDQGEMIEPELLDESFFDGSEETGE